MTASFPLASTTIRSATDFHAFRQGNAFLLDERYRREQSLGVRDGLIDLDGSCALCLLPAGFRSSTAGGSPTADGRIVPNWQEQQVCDCGRALNSRGRALLQLARTRGGGQDWCRAAVLGPEDPFSRAAVEMLHPVHHWTRFDRRGDRLVLAAGIGGTHLAVCADMLHLIPAIGPALQEVARILCPGGTLLFTVPLLIDRDATQSSALARLPVAEAPAVASRPVHDFGWDLLPIVERAGFASCVAHCYWSEEFGYLGPFNLVFEAER